LPFYSAEVEVAQLVIEPKVSKEAKQLAYEKITELRERIINGDNFNSLATLYSDDGSAAKGGELGFFTRGQMVPEFEAAAFKLKPDTISKVIETKYGYHILKLIDRKGDNINVRHILVRPKIFKSDVAAARERMDSIIWQVKIDSISFEKAVKRFSDDNFTKGNGGFITAEQTGSTKIAIDELDKEIYYKLEGLKPGDMTEPELITLPGPDRQQVWRVFYLKSESKPHRANLRDDYQKFQAMAMQRKQQRAMETFMNKTKKDLYIQVNPPYKSCKQVVEFLKK
jgi:peptidyl-prolyl cis-trans isomerase SurA